MKHTLAAALFVSIAAGASAQAPLRRATNIAALDAYPGFYHQRPIVVVGTVKTSDRNEISITNEEGATLRVIARGGAPDGLDEVRGEFVDVGRLRPDDPRLTPDLQQAFHLTPDGPWPRPGDLKAIVAAAVAPAERPPAPSIRAIVLRPSRYVEQKVTIRGQFEGRNLAGDLPDAPGQSRYDFVLRSADAAIWVARARPKGKGFDLSLDRRLDTGRWLEVSGTVRGRRGLQWIDAEAGTLKLTTAEPAPEQAAPSRGAPGPPPEVLFSVPTQDETDVSQSSTVRVQFSRDLDPATIEGHVAVRYLDSETAVRGEPTTPTAAFTTEYRGGNRELIITFTKPLERFRTVRIELTSGITGTDGQPLKPWTLSFGVGGS